MNFISIWETLDSHDSCTFTNPYQDKINYMNAKYLKGLQQFESKEIRELASYLVNQGHTITFFGKAWSKQVGNWVYFDTVLDLESLRNHFQLASHITVHQNLDPKSGTEKGFIDQNTGEGVMGKLE